MKREYFCYGTATDGTVIFARDVNNEVQLFDAERIQRETQQRACLSDKLGHNVKEDFMYICYWSRKDGKVDFARNIHKDVQLFSKTEAESGAKNGGCLITKVGFIGIGKDGMPLETK
jgi:hypothetical protein